MLTAMVTSARAQTQWQGLLDDDWQQASLWSAGVPDLNTNAVIDGPFLRAILSGAGETDDLIVGRTLVGNLTVNNGGTLTSSTGYIGFQPTATGDVTLTGAATWQLDDLYMGGTATVDGGVGTLNVLSGSLIDVQQTLKLWSDGSLVLDNANGNVGSLAMEGGTFTMQNNAAAFVNTLQLTADNLIQVTNSSLTIANDVETTSFLDLDLNGGFFGTSNFRVTDADLTLQGGGTWSNSGEIRLGHQFLLDHDDDPELWIDDYQISSGDVVVGDERTAFVFFRDGTWDAANLILGRESAAGVTVGKFDTGPQLDLTGDLRLGLLGGSDGRLDLRYQTGVMVDGQVEVGIDGRGVIRIFETASLQSDGTVWIGRNSPWDNEIEIGENGNLTAGSDLVVGDGGRGILTVESGAGEAASVSSQSVFIGLQAGSEGEASLSGENASWLSNGIFSVGTSGAGDLTIMNGANLDSGSSSIGTLGGSVGDVVVTGATSQWLMTGLDVGRSGAGTLTISDGAQVGSTTADVAVNPGSTGVVTVQGAGSGWTIANELYLGGDNNGTGGDATLRIEDGAVVTADQTFLLTGGLLTGHDGLLESDVFNAGEVSPGASPGIMTIDGNFTMLSGGVLLLEVEGLTPGIEYDQLIVTQTLDLNAGSIMLDFSGYAGLAEGDLFQFFPGQNLTGQMLDITMIGMNPALAIDTASFGATGTFEVIPEPSTGLLLTLAGFFLLNRRRSLVR